MADENGSPGERLSWLERLARAPGTFDFHVALRRLEAAFAARPRLGKALRPAEEPIRIGQDPSLGFEPTAVTRFTRSEGALPARLGVSFLGLWGPNGPLPIHLTEYARERWRHAGDRTLASFVDIFHHRMLLIFHRAWAQTQPTALLDRLDLETDEYAKYLGSIFGLGFAGTRGRDRFPDRAKLFYAGRFASSARSAEGLRAVIADYFGLPTAIEEFVGAWLPLPPECRWQLGAPDSSTLGKTAVLGGRVWTRTARFRIVLGPLSRSDFHRMRPESEEVAALSALVRLYTNDEWGWDIRFTLDSSAISQIRLAHGARLGWSSRIGRGVREDLVFDPISRKTQRIRVTPG
jgi:type VI secretion system protein ImpH